VEKIYDELKKINKKLEKLDALDQRIIAIEGTVQGLFNSQEFLSAQYDTHHKDTEEIKIEVKRLKEKNLSLIHLNTKLENDLEKNKAAVYDLQQYGRREMLEMNGIPSKPNEDTDSIVLDIAKSVELELSLYDIEISHRLSKKPNATIIVKFNNRRFRNEFYSRVRHAEVKCSDIGFEGLDDRIYVNDSLCDHYRRLLQKCKETFRPAFKYVWTRNGSVFIRQHDRSKVFKINSENDINYIYYILMLSTTILLLPTQTIIIIIIITPIQILMLKQKVEGFCFTFFVLTN